MLGLDIMTCVQVHCMFPCCHVERHWHARQVAQFGGQEERRILLDAAFDERDDAWGYTVLNIACGFASCIRLGSFGSRADQAMQKGRSGVCAAGILHGTV